MIAREILVKYFKRYEVFILPALKFILGLFVFYQIYSIGHISDAMAPLTDSFSPVMGVLLLAILFTIVPMNLSWALIIISVTVQFSANIEIAIAVFLFLLFIFLFYARMAPKESILILLTIVAFQFNVPYLVPLVVGLYFPITAIIPVVVGVFVNAQIPTLFGLMTPGGAIADMAELDIADMLIELPTAITAIYTPLVTSITSTQNWLHGSVIFAMVIILVHFVSRYPIDYSKEIAILLGCVMNIFGFIVAVLQVGENINIGLVILLTIVCGCLAIVVRFFDSVLDYQRAESVQFEDDNNYYHVKIVPKVIMTKTHRVVKRIRPQANEPRRYEDE